MSENTKAGVTNNQGPSNSMRSEIEGKWGKFSAQEIGAIRSNDDLVAQVQTKYDLDKTQAQREVDAFAKGRQL